MLCAVLVYVLCSLLCTSMYSLLCAGMYSVLCTSMYSVLCISMYSVVCILACILCCVLACFSFCVIVLCCHWSLVVEVSVLYYHWVNCKNCSYPVRDFFFVMICMFVMIPIIFLPEMLFLSLQDTASLAKSFMILPPIRIRR